MPVTQRASSRPGWSAALWLTVALSALMPAWPVAAPAGDPPPETSPAGLSPAARIAELQRAGRVAEALDLARRENAAHPGQPLMLYNQACLESRAGQVPEALRTLQAAFAAGFADDVYALADPDLQGAAADGVRRVVDEYRQRRAAMSVRRGTRLAEGQPAVLRLAAAAGGADPGASLTVIWRPTGLALRLEADDAGGHYLPAAGAAPWTGNGGLVVALGTLTSAAAGECDDSFVFAFGLEKNAGVGAMFVDETGRWQRVRELQPKIRGAGTSRLLLDVLIPWTAIAPYHPLTDAVLGLNANLLRSDRRDGPQLMPARVLDRLGSPHQPAARLAFDPGTASPGIVRGRVPTTIVTSGTLALNLVTVCDLGGRGSLTIDFQDSEGHSLLADGPAPEAVELQAGLNTLNRAVDFRQLRGGPCRVSAAVTSSSGAKAEWAAWLLNLGPGWEPLYRSAIGALPPEERPTAAYYLDALSAAVDTHRARRDPGALTTTLGDLNLMLARFEQHGTLVPAEGLTPFVYPGPGGADRLCRLVVPPGRPSGAPLVPVLVAGHAAADAPRLAERILRRFGASGTDSARARPAWWPVFVVAPGTDRADSGSTASRQVPATNAEAELRHGVRWARERYDVGRLLVVAQRDAVAPALTLAGTSPTASVGDLLIFADGALAPWPGDTAAERLRRIAAPPPGLTVTWVDFVQETASSGGATALAAALRKAGWSLQAESVRGSPGYTQIADRTCAWLEKVASAR